MKVATHTTHGTDAAALVLQAFDFESQAVRLVSRDGEPWFVAADVCRALEIANGRDAVRSLEADEKGVANTDTPGGKQNLTIINESGLYALVFKSRKPVARRFRKWVTSEVIPAIRRTGRYEVTPEAEDREMAWVERDGRELMTIPDFLEAPSQELGRRLPHAVEVATGLEAGRMVRAYRVAVPYTEHGLWGPKVGLFTVQVLKRAWALKGRPALRAYDQRHQQREFGFLNEAA